MGTCILYRSDFSNEDAFEYLLERAGIETHELINGKVVDLMVEECDFTPITEAGLAKWGKAK